MIYFSQKAYKVETDEGKGRRASLCEVFCPTSGARAEATED